MPKTFRALTTKGAELAAGEQREDGTVVVWRVASRDLPKDQWRYVPSMDLVLEQLATMTTGDPEIVWEDEPEPGDE